MKGIITLLFLLVGNAWADDGLNDVDKEQLEKLTSSRLVFTYQSFSGDTYIRCSHQRAPWMGWNVTCDHKKFYVHLVLSRYIRPVVPKASYELLYWVTDRNLDIPHTVGSTTWFHLKEFSDLHEIYVSQSIERDTAGLYLRIRF